MKNKYGEVIVDRQSCVFCGDNRFCHQRIFTGRPADCPRAVEKREEHEKATLQ